MTINKNGSLHIGCSGYYYTSWKGNFYPKDLVARRWLEYYSGIFNSVELNSSFYRKPQLGSLKRYAAMTPAKFQFAVKMSRYITHILKMKNCAESVKEMQDVVLDGLGDKLGAFLFQLPATFRYGAENLEHVLATVPPGAHNIVEFRHPSWWNDDVQNALSDNNITFCNVDYPGMETFYMTTTDVFYLRLHGNPVLFKSDYSTDDLNKFARAMPVNCKKYYVYFNNTWFGAAYTNAAELKEILEQMKRPVHA